MKVPVSWLTAYTPVDLPDAAAVADFAEFLSRHGLEVEGVQRPGAGTSGVITARVLSWVPHPNADKLRVVQITHGDDQVELVCGASNFDEGDIVAHAAPGGSIPGMVMEARELRGVVSNGMLASARELELGGDMGKTTTIPGDADGIMILDPDTPLGVDLTSLLPLGEPVIEISGKGIRGDHQSVLGIARDVAALKDLPLTIADEPEPGVLGTTVEVDIQAPTGCTHFVVQAMENVVVPASSPWWLRQRLAQSGVRSISPIVDITNYVMVDLGQPMHAYDLDKVVGAKLGVRWGREGETVVTLDDQERAIIADDLVIIDGEDTPIGLAGVMGGASTEVSPTTTRVAFEAAIWNPDTIRDTSRRLRLLSEASNRFERGVDHEGAHRACGRAAQLLGQLGSFTDLGVTEDGVRSGSRPTVTLDPARVAAFIGLDELTASRQQELLVRVGCAVVADGDQLQVTPPSWRSDLGRFADLAEEVARLHGFDRIPATLPRTGLVGRRTSVQRARDEVRDAVRGAGLHEIVSRPFVGDENQQGLLPTPNLVNLVNPLAKDAAAMRPSLVEALLQAVRRNVGQGRPGVAIFELAHIFRVAGDPLDAVLDATLRHTDWRWTSPDGKVLPTQPMVAGFALQGHKLGWDWLDDDQPWSVLDGLAIADEIVRAASDRRLGPLARRSVERTGFHPGRTAVLDLGGVEVGVVGQLHPHTADERDLPEPVIVGEILLDPLLALAKGEPLESRAIPTHPAMSVDVAVVADEDIPWARVAEALRAGAGELLDDLRLFDTYRGDQVGAGRRSLAARLRLQDPDRQLTGEDEQHVLAAITAQLDTLDGAELRT